MRRFFNCNTIVKQSGALVDQLYTSIFFQKKGNKPLNVRKRTLKADYRYKREYCKLF